MFCDKCGHSNKNGARFCEQCGAPMDSDVTQLASSPDETPATRVWNPGEQPDTWQPPKQPRQQAPWQPQKPEPWKPDDDGYEQVCQHGQEYNQSYNQRVNQGYDGAYPPEYPSYPSEYDRQPPEPPKKGLSKTAKKAIIFSSVGAGVLAVVLIILFAVILPNANRSNPSDISRYYVLSFAGVDEGVRDRSVSDGKISGRFTWDYQQFALDRQIPKSKAQSLLDDIGTVVEKQYLLNGSVTAFSSFDNLKASDTIKVSFIWPSGAAEKKLAENYEKTYGVQFSHDYSAREYNVGEILRQKNVTIKQQVEANILQYIADNNLFAEEVGADGKAKVSVKGFEAKISGYTFRLRQGSLSVVVIDDRNFEIGKFDLALSNSVNLRSGDTVTLKYDSYAARIMLDKGIVLQGESVTYTVKAPQPTTVPATEPPTTVPATEPATEAPTEAPSEAATEAATALPTTAPHAD